MQAATSVLQGNPDNIFARFVTSQQPLITVFDGAKKKSILKSLL
jgi:hypothetical protein